MTRTMDSIQEKYIYTLYILILEQKFLKVLGTQSKYPCIKLNPLRTLKESHSLNLYLPGVLKGS